MNPTHLLKEYKQSHSCVICGESDPCCLEFHHIFPDEKLFSLSKRLHKDITEEDVIREMNKTCLLCANCHRKLHNGRLNITKKQLYKKRVKV